MTASTSSDRESSASVSQNTTATEASSPPEQDSPQSAKMINEHVLEKEEESARVANEKVEESRRQALLRRRKKKKPETKSERETKAKELDELLMKSAAFSDILTKKTQVLGRVGSSLDGQTLGEHNLEMAKQPDCLVGGTMRDYQLEGLTWMYEICSQGMSGILADEMGLGKLCSSLNVKIQR
jgi:ATP-dependent DNA helicase